MIYAALLRAVNVGGRSLTMADLKALAIELGFGNPRTLLQSGNIVFEGGERKPQEIERALEEGLAKKLGLSTEFMVRTLAELDAAIKANPFPDEAKNDPGHLLVVFLKDAPKADAVKALQEAIPGREVVKPGEKHVYMSYPDGIGRSKVTMPFIEKRLSTRGTGRNWNTVIKLRDLAAA